MNMTQLLGLVTGILFGVLLQKAHILRFEKVINALLIKDATVIKFLLAAVLVGMIGIRILADAGFITFAHKSMNVGGVLLGGVLFGIGLPFMGFCPGTSGAAVAEGRWHAIFAVLGMLTGGVVFAALYPFFRSTVLSWKDFGTIGLPEAFGVSAWVVIPIVALAILSAFMWFEKNRV